MKMRERTCGLSAEQDDGGQAETAEFEVNRLKACRRIAGGEIPPLREVAASAQTSRRVIMGSPSMSGQSQSASWLMPTCHLI